MRTAEAVLKLVLCPDITPVKVRNRRHTEKDAFIFIDKDV